MGTKEKKRGIKSNLDRRGRRRKRKNRRAGAAEERSSTKRREDPTDDTEAGGKPRRRRNARRADTGASVGNAGVSGASGTGRADGTKGRKKKRRKARGQGKSAQGSGRRRTASKLGHEFIGKIRGNVVIPLKNIGWQTLREIRRDLCLWDKKKEKNLKIFLQGKKTIRVPRQYAIDEFGPAVFSDDMTTGKDIDFIFYGKLRKKYGQLDMVTSARNKIRPGYGGIIRAPCGSGKTVMGLFLASQWGNTTLVLVHTKRLRRQWRKRAKKFLKLKDDEIGMLQGDVCDFKGKKMVIGMVQSLASAARGRRENYPEAFYKWAGTIILDEVHRHAAATWHRAIGLFPAAYRLGLSATPERKDGMTQVILWHVGPIVAETDVYQVEPEVYQVKFGIYLNHMAICEFRRGRPAKRTSLARLINALAKHKDRNDMLAYYISEALAAGRCVLVLSDRLAQLDTLMEAVRLRLEDDSIMLAKCVGGMTEDEEEESITADGMFGTYKYASEGMDVPPLDTLVMATPRADVEQSVGRILREQKGKKIPVVVDPVDSVELCEIFGNKRRGYFERQDWVVVDREWCGD